MSKTDNAMLTVSPPQIERDEYDTFPSEVAMVAQDFLQEKKPEWFLAFSADEPPPLVRQHMVRFGVSFVNAYDRIEGIADLLPAPWEDHLLPETLRRLGRGDGNPFDLSTLDVLAIWKRTYDHLADQSRFEDYRDIRSLIDREIESIESSSQAETLIGLSPGNGETSSRHDASL